jgi:hypothetical protein
VEHLIASGVKPQLRMLRDLPNADPQLLPKLDLLYTLLLGILKHLINWLISFLKQYYHLIKFNEVLLSVPAYLKQCVPNKTYEQVKQWAGKDLHMMANYLLVCLHAALRKKEDSGGKRISKTTNKLFDRVLVCTHHFLEFHMYAYYTQLDEGTLKQMDELLKAFHNSKEILLQIRVG